MDFLVIFFAAYLGYILIGGLAVFILKDWGKHISLIPQMIVAAILSRGIITETIRFLWDRSRPFVEQNFVPLIPHAASASFPSGHASFYFAISFVLLLYNKKAGAVFLAASALMGLARVAAGLHWFSDIVAGAAIGGVSAWIAVKLWQRYRVHIWKQ